MTVSTQDGNGSSRRKRFVKCGHFGFGQFCHRCQQADALEKSENEKKGEKMDPKSLATRLASLRAVPGVASAPAAAVKAEVKVDKVEAAEVPKPSLSEKERAMRFNPLPSLGDVVEEKSELMARINANAQALSEG